jgi:hypothetical protein
MSSASIARVVTAAPAGRVPESAPVDGAPPAKDGRLTAIAAWIPSEALVTYTTVYGIFLAFAGGDATVIGSGEQWMTFVIAVAVGLGLLAFHAIKERQAQDPAPPLPTVRLVGSAVLMLIALSIYVMNLPGNPLTGTFNWHPAVPAILAFLAAGFLPKVAELVKVKPQQPAAV